MTPLFKKLNFRNQKEIYLINHPSEFEAEVTAMQEFAKIKTSIEANLPDFVLVLVKTQSEVDQIVPMLLPKLKGDPIVWFAYPKGTSKKYKAEINRDKGWDILRAAGYETVRAVAIDDDWSALRFRKTEYIKSRI